MILFRLRGGLGQGLILILTGLAFGTLSLIYKILDERGSGSHD